MIYTEWDWDTALEVAHEEGVEEGLSQGIAEGEAKVLALLEKGLSLEEIKQRLTQTKTN